MMDINRTCFQCHIFSLNATTKLLIFLSKPSQHTYFLNTTYTWTSLKTFASIFLNSSQMARTSHAFQNPNKTGPIQLLNPFKAFHLLMYNWTSALNHCIRVWVFISTVDVHAMILHTPR